MGVEEYKLTYKIEFGTIFFIIASKRMRFHSYTSRSGGTVRVNSNVSPLFFHQKIRNIFFSLFLFQGILSPNLTGYLKSYQVQPAQ
jgi:hypothetical protein